MMVELNEGSGSFASFNTVGAHPRVRPYNSDKEKRKEKRARACVRPYEAVEREIKLVEQTPVILNRCLGLLKKWR